MYYKEEFIDGDWYWKGHPQGTWVKFKEPNYLKKIKQLRAQIIRLQHQS